MQEEGNQHYLCRVVVIRIAQFLELEQCRSRAEREAAAMGIVPWDPAVWTPWLQSGKAGELHGDSDLVGRVAMKGWPAAGELQLEGQPHLWLK